MQMNKTLAKTIIKTRSRVSATSTIDKTAIGEMGAPNHDPRNHPLIPKESIKQLQLWESRSIAPWTESRNLTLKTNF